MAHADSGKNRAYPMKVRPARLCPEIIDACRVQERPPEILVDLLAPMPGRWGRMDLLSRLAIAGTGYLLRQRHIRLDGLVAGLVAGTRCGCLNTDLSFINTMHDNMPSPVIFSYTLPNTALSEAAAFFGMTGPVYSVLDTAEPCTASFAEAARILEFFPGVDLMICGELDACPGTPPVVMLDVMEKHGSHVQRACQ